MRSVIRFLLATVMLALFSLPNAFAQGDTNAVTNIISFQSTNYTVFEDSFFATITVRREGPAVDPVLVDFEMFDQTARSGIDYFSRTGTLFFGPGEVIQTFFVQLIDNFGADGDRTVMLTLVNPIGTGDTVAVLANDPNPTTAMLTIRDDESNNATVEAGEVEIARGNGGAYPLGSPETYAITEEEWIQRDIGNFAPFGPAGAQVTIIRRGGAKGRILVDWFTTTNVIPSFDFLGQFFFGLGGGLARPNFDFIPTNGTVALDDFQMSTNIVIQIPSSFSGSLFSTNGLVFSNPFEIFGAPVSFGISLTNVRAAPDEAGLGINPRLGPASTRIINVVPNDAGFAFYRLHYQVSEGIPDGIVRINVKRSFEFSQGVTVRYVVNPGNLIITGSGGDHLDNVFPLEPGSDYASPFTDFLPPASDEWSAATGIADDEAMLRWDANDSRDRQLVVVINDDNEAEFNEDLYIQLFKLDGETDGAVNPFAGTAVLKILDNDQPAGASEVTFNRDNDALTDPPYMTTPGANNTVQALAVQPDGKVILGGDFSAVNTTNRNGIARLNFDGSTDRSFSVGTGVGSGGFVRAVALQPDGNILVGGYFDSINGIARNGIARLTTNGIVDTSFNPGLGVDGAIRTIAMQPDGKILIGGEFTTFDGTNRNYIARLNPNGKLDTTFEPGFGPDQPVNSIAVSGGALDIDREASGGPAEDRFLVDTGSSSGSITVNYDFLNVPDQLRIYHGGVLIYDSGLINGAGSVTANYGPPNSTSTSTFLEIVMNEGSGLFGTIWFYGLQIQPNIDDRPVIGGEFTDYNGTPINFIARLNTDGSIDSTFQPGTGADDVVYSVAKQGNKVLLAGEFNQIDERPRRGVARLNEDGSLDEQYETGAGFDNTVYTVAVQPNGKAVFGGAFKSFNFTRRVGMARLNLDGTLDTSFMDTAKNQFAGVPNPFSDDNIQSQENFIRALAPYRLTNISFITNLVITNDITNEVIITNISMSDHLFAGGRFTRFGGGFHRQDIRSRLNIARIQGGATPGPGNIAFVNDFYSADENAGRTFITLTRTNGSLAPVSAQFNASDRPPGGPGVAKAGADYAATNYFPIWIRSHDRDREYSAAFMGPNNNAFSTNRQRGDFNIYPFPERPPLWFNNYDEDNIFVTILDDNLIEGDEVVGLSLTAPDQGRLLLGGEPIPVGTALGKASATLIITDNDFDFGTLGFSDVEYFVNENDVDAVITVTREGGASGAVTVDAYTQDITANISDYNPIQKRTLTFANGQTSTKFTVRIKNDLIAELEEKVLLLLTNATGFPANVAPERRLEPARSTAILNILDDDFAPGRLSFTQAAYTNREGAGEIVVEVRRSGGNAGNLTVNFRTVDETAIAGIDYTGITNTLQWVDGETGAKTIRIPVFGNSDINPSKSFRVEIFDPSIGEALGAQPIATVVLEDDDAAGTFSFSQPEYRVDENGPYADITVLRLGGIAGTVSVEIGVTNITAVGASNAPVTMTNGVPDYLYPTNTLLTFNQEETSKSFRIPVLDDRVVEGDKRVGLSLFNPTGGANLGLSNSVLVIMDNELNNIPAGSLDTTFESTGTDDFIYSLALQEDQKILLGGDFHFINDVVRNRLARLNPNGTIDQTFDPVTGPDSTVRSLDIQSDGRLFVGGLFTNIATTNRFHVARLNIDSKVDPTFNPGAGTDNQVYSILEQPDGKLLMVGDFTTYRGINRRGIARASTNGVADPSFNTGTGANGTVYAVALQSDGKILIGGDFTTFNEQPRSRIARLNKDGSLDTTFVAGANESVRAILVQPDGNILIGGLFTSVNGADTMRRIARLRANGDLDPAFNFGSTSVANAGANGPVNVLALQIDGKILAGGDFTTFNGRTRNRLTRLNADGSIDPTINFGSGFNGSVSAILVQPDRRIIVAGGFTQYNGVARKNIARIHGGAISGNGSLQFTMPFFTVSESGKNAIVTVRRTGGTEGTVAVDFKTIADTAGTNDFTNVSTTLIFEEGETFRSVLIPVQADDQIDPDKFVNLQLSNPQGGALLGAQPTARLTIVNDDMEISFSSAAYSVTENFVTGAATITIRRLGSTAAPVSVLFQTATPETGGATPGFDYVAVSNVVNFAVGETSRTFSIPIIDDQLVEGSETINLVLSNLVVQNPDAQARFGTPSSATLTIVDDDKAAGKLRFASTQFTGIESSGQIQVTIERVEGSSGVVSLDFATRPGPDPAATIPSDYSDITGIVTFADGEIVKSFIIPINPDTVVEGNENITVTISNPRGNATIIGPTSALAVIVDDDLAPGSLDNNFTASANGPVRVVKLSTDEDIYLGGEFSMVNGEDRSRIGRLNSDGALDTAFIPSAINNPVSDLEFETDGSLLISGDFNTVGGVFHNRVARLNNSGQVEPTFNLPLGLNADVLDIARRSDGRVLIGGMFNVASAAGRNRIAQLNPDGTVDSSFDPGVGADSTVYSLALQEDGKVLVGGAFSSINGAVRRGIARLNTNGSVDSTFNPGFGFNGIVHDILILTNTGKILVVGDFTAYNGQTRFRAAMLESNGALDATFIPGSGTASAVSAGPNAGIYAVAPQSDGKFIIVGDFTSISNGVQEFSRNRIARLNANGSLDTTFTPGDGANGAVLSVAIQPQDGKIVIGGRFTKVDRIDRAYIARLNNDEAFRPVEEDVVLSNVTVETGQLRFVFASSVGSQYTLQTSTNLEQWFDLTNVEGGENTTEIVQPASETFRFYRIIRK